MRRLRPCLMETGALNAVFRFLGLCDGTLGNPRMGVNAPHQRDVNENVKAGHLVIRPTADKVGSRPDFLRLGCMS